jgi:hypothetical protein
MTENSNDKTECLSIITSCLVMREFYRNSVQSLIHQSVYLTNCAQRLAKKKDFRLFQSSSERYHCARIKSF